MVARLRIDRTGDWQKLKKIFGRKRDFKKLTDDKLVEASRAAAIIYAEELRKGYRQSRAEFKRNHPFTLSMKRSDKPLRDTGKLGDSVRAIRTSRGYDAGIADKDLAKIANIQEEGALIKVTEKSRKYLAAIGFPLKASTKFIVIPARPNFALSFKAALPKMRKSVDRIVKRTLD